jgi:hypothetical protein
MFFWNYSRENALTGCAISSASNPTLKRTEQSNIAWIRRFICLPNLTVEWWGYASTQNQALSGLRFVYREGLDLAGIDAVRAKQLQDVPTLLTQQEAIAPFSTSMSPPHPDCSFQAIAQIP